MSLESQFSKCLYMNKKLIYKRFQRVCGKAEIRDKIKTKNFISQYKVHHARRDFCKQQYQLSPLLKKWEFEEFNYVSNILFILFFSRNCWVLKFYINSTKPKDVSRNPIKTVRWISNDFLSEKILTQFLCLKNYLFRISTFQRQREKQREKGENVPYTGSLPRWPQMPGLDQREVRMQELHLGFQNGCQGPKHLAHPLLSFPGH